MSVLPNSRLSIITLGVKDRAAMTAFYRDVIGFKLFNEEGMTMFDMGGLVLGLWEYDKLADDAGQSVGPASGFKGTAIAYNTRSVEEVDEIFVRLEQAAVTITTAPHKAFWGGYSGYFADPEGNAWEVAYNPFWKLDEVGRLVLPTEGDSVMALRRFDLEAGGDSFAFKPETEPTIAFWLGKYPEDKKRSAVIPMLWLAQKDNEGWLSEPAMREVADRLEMPYIRVYEVATFYTMFRLQPVGKNHVQLCGTTPCMLRGANDLKEVCRKKIGDPMHVTDNGRLSWEEVECLGACVNAPMVQINDYYYEDLTPESFEEILSKLENGAEVKPGPFVDRLNSAPQGGATSLLGEDLYDGSRNAIAKLPNLPADAPAEPEPVPAPVKEAKTTLIKDSKPAPKAEDKPETVEIAAGEEDDLKRIKGIGPVNEKALNELGVYKFSQIAAWTPANVDWVEDFMSFPGRIEREDWIAQAKTLADGEETEFSKRVDAGEVDSSKDEEES